MPGKRESENAVEQKPKKRAQNRPSTGNKTGRPNYMPSDICLELYKIVATLPEETQKAFADKVSFREVRIDITPDPDNVRLLGYINAARGCQAVGIRLADAFANAGHPLKWPTDTMAELDKILCSMDTTEIEKVKTLMLELTPAKWISEGQTYSQKPSTRALWIIQNKTLMCGQRKELVDQAINADTSTSGKNSWGRGDRSRSLSPSNHFYRPVTIDQALSVAENVGMVPTWVLGMADGELAVLSTSAESEYILAAYAAMSPENQHVFEKVLKAYKGAK